MPVVDDEGEGSCMCKVRWVEVTYESAEWTRGNVVGSEVRTTERKRQGRIGCEMMCMRERER